MAIERALTLYMRNTTTVDTGVGIDVRVLDDVNGATDDATQTATATHTQDNALRTFDPATAVGATVANPWTLQRKGWAVAVADMTPSDDTNCNVILPAGSATLTFDATLTAAIGGVDTTSSYGPAWPCALWAYDPATDAGVLLAIASPGGPTWNPQPIGGDGGTYKTVTVTLEFGGSRTVTNKALTANVATLTTSAAHRFQVGMVVEVSIGDPVFDGTHTITAVAAGGASTTFSYAKVNADVASAAASGTAVVSKVEFAGGSVLMLQIGLNTATIPNAVSGTTTYTFTVRLDNNNGKLVLSPSGLGQVCRFAYAGALDLAGAVSETTRRFRTHAAALSLDAASSDRLTMFRTASAALALDAAYSDLLTLRRAVVAALDLAAVRQGWTIRLRNASLVAALELNAARVLTAKRAFAAALDLAGTADTVLTGFRSFAAALDLSAAYARVLTKRPSFTATLTLGAQLWVKISQDVLNRIVSGGSTIVRKVLYIFDD